MNHQKQLQVIQKAAGWSQEQLAARLEVSFATLNSWINSRSQPRPKARQAIGALYLEIVGAETVDDQSLMRAKKTALKQKATAQRLIQNQPDLDKLTLFLTYHTNTIEGSTMTLADVEEVIFDDKVLSNRTAVEQTEARNHQAALHWLLDEIVAKGQNFAINEALIRDIHLRLMHGIISDAGQYRRQAVRIVGANVPLANWQKVPGLLQILMADLQRSSADTIELLATTHARFEQIHPFSDGNGRTGRLIMLAQALQAGVAPPLVVKERKKAYYKYLELAQVKSQLKPLQLFVAESMQLTANLLSKD